MTTNDDNSVDDHTRIILARYAHSAGVKPHDVDRDVLISRYLSKVIPVEQLAGKTILEIGAGCSLYVPIFLEFGCARYYANDLVPERLEAVRSADPRYVELPGDFRRIGVPEPVDIVFASLTMMFVIPMLEEFVAKIGQSLKPGGIFLGMDPNYFCPMTLYRYVRDRENNPSRMFSPFAYANVFRRHGFEIEALLPFTAPVPGVTGNWLLGTSFWLRARKK